MTPGNFTVFFLITISHIFYNTSPFLRLKMSELRGLYFRRYYGSFLCRLGLNLTLLECCQILSVYAKIVPVIWETEDTVL